MRSTDTLIDTLSARVAPVRRRSVRREAGTLLALGMAELALLLMAHGLRPDMGQVITSPYMMWKIGSMALLAAVTCTVAVRSFVPPAPSLRGLQLAAIMAGLVMLVGPLVATAADGERSLLDRLSPVHGLFCAGAIIVLALPMIVLLTVLMRQAAPVRPDRSALATGLAASTCGALIFTACCPMNDPLYIIVWYSAGVGIVTAAARWVLPRRFRL